MESFNNVRIVFTQCIGLRVGASIFRAASELTIFRDGVSMYYTIDFEGFHVFGIQIMVPVMVDIS